jgi:hypothetical protein
MASTEVVLQNVMCLLGFAAPAAMPRYYLVAGLIQDVACHSENLVSSFPKL